MLLHSAELLLLGLLLLLLFLVIYAAVACTTIVYCEGYSYNGYTVLSSEDAVHGSSSNVFNTHKT